MLAFASASASTRASRSVLACEPLKSEAGGEAEEEAEEEAAPTFQHRRRRWLAPPPPSQSGGEGRPLSLAARIAQEGEEAAKHRHAVGVRALLGGGARKDPPTLGRD